MLDIERACVVHEWYGMIVVVFSQKNGVSSGGGLPRHDSQAYRIDR